MLHRSLHRFLAALLLAGALALPVAPAHAGTACSGTSGVTVVVQFENEPVQVGCAPGDPGSGYQALKGAGFRVTNATWVNGAPVCQINEQPADAKSCWGSKYWSYWRARPGQQWAYSNVGAGGTDPAPGSYEGWHFTSSMTPPDFPAPPAPKPTATPTSKPTSRPTSGAPSAPAPTKGSTAVAPPGSTPTAPDATSSGAATSSPSADAAATATDGTTPAEDASSGAAASGATSSRPVSAPGSDDSPNRSWIWGVGLVCVLAAAAATTAVRRRRG